MWASLQGLRESAKAIIEEMIKFFRRIRYDLMETKPTSAKASAGLKTGRYLKYAIGEIILVVIGILIAVQINDWNEHRKMVLNSKTHLQKMILELETTKARMERLTTNKAGQYSYGYPPLDEAVSNCDSLLKLSYSGITKAHLPFILKSRFFSGRSSLNIQQDVFEQAKSNGQLNTLGSEKLVTAIKAYHARCVRESGYQEGYNDEVLRAINKIENGFGKLLLDYKMDSINFSPDHYRWLFDPKSTAYQDMQISISLVKELQAESMKKMQDITTLSDSLLVMIRDELNTSQ